MAVFVATETCRACLAIGESHHDSRDLCGDLTIAELLRKHLEIEIVGDELMFVCCGCLQILREINKLRRVANANSKEFQKQATRLDREYESATGDSSRNTLFSPPMNHRCIPWPTGMKAYSTPKHEEPDNLRLLREALPQSPQIYESVWNSEIAEDSENCLEGENVLNSSRSTNSIDLPQYQTFRSSASSDETVVKEPQVTSERDESLQSSSETEVAFVIRFDD